MWNKKLKYINTQKVILALRTFAISIEEQFMFVNVKYGYV
jgi:hypothetical protein